jgi:tRNA dimethylallyltransferase
MKILLMKMIANMMSSINKNLIIILGPTAIGKTALAIKIAQELNTEILSSDSRQFYKELSIGTATPSLKELEKIKHHFIQHISVKEKYNIGKFEKEALSKIKDLFKNKDNIVMVGGSGLYIDAICKGIDTIPEIALDIRQKINSEFEEKGLEWLQNKVQEIDPEYFQYVDKKNPQRLIRAVEIFTGTSKKLSSLQKKKNKKRDFNIIKIGVKMERDLLYNRINNRVDKMIENGLIDEVKSLISYRKYNALNTVGYKELFDYIDGVNNLENSISMIKQNTRRLAKRQITWFKKDKEISWFNKNEFNSITTTILK